MRNRDKFRRYDASVTMRIGGVVVNKIAARYAYRCADCLGELDYWGAGLACKANKEHHFFVHKSEVAGIQAQRTARIDEALSNYEIIDGLLRPKKEVFRDAY
jgi:hypothetical protein